MDSKTRRQPKQMSEAEKLQNFKIIQTMNKQINFQKNPRYQTIRPPVSISSLPLTVQESSVFSATPSQIVFQDYHANNIYQIPLSLTNRSHRFQRLRIVPPSSSQFSITDIKYPNELKGDVAPGMSVTMNVNFNASSLQDFDDLIQIVTEEDFLNIDVKARKEQPNLNLQEVLVCPSTFLGDKSSVVFKVVNKGGGAGFKVFSQEMISEEDQVIKMENFSLYPTEFYLQKGQSVALNVNFHPRREGKLEQKFTLACDNLTNAEYTLRGVANIVEFEVVGLDQQVFNKGDTLSTIFFQNGLMYHTIQRQLVIKNLTSVQVNYHWDIHKPQENGFNVEEGPRIFWIEPSSGIFPPQKEINFTLFFNGQEQVLYSIQIPYFQDLSMIIEDVPVESVKNINQNLRDNNRSSLTYLSFKMVGLMKETILDVTPAFYNFTNSLNIRTKYKHTVQIKNLSESDTHFQILLDRKSEEALSYQLSQTQGKISSFQTIDIEIELSSTKISKHQSLYFWVKFDSNEIKAFQLSADFNGPSIRVIEPLIDFAIVNPYSTNHQSITIENISDIPCEVICQNADPLYNLKKTPEEYGLLEIHTYKRFKPTKIALQPREKRVIPMSFTCRDTQIFQQNLEFSLEHGDSHVIEVYAEVQEVYVSLNRYSLSFNELYLNEKYEISPNDPQAIVLQNRGNIPTNFRWIQKDLPNVRYSFEPSAGTIQPKQKITVHFKFSPLIGPLLDEIFICHIDNLEHPLGIQLTTKVLGLDVKYDLMQPQQIFTPQHANTTSSLSKKLHDFKATPLELIDFTASQIKQISTMRFTLTNTSGISTKYDFSFEKYEPTQHTEEKLKKKETRQSMTMRSSSHTHQSKDSMTMTNNSMKPGNYRLEEKLPLIKQLEKNSNLYLSSNKGIALTCEPAFGNLGANKSVDVKVTLYNDICGLFNDSLIVDIDGLPQKKIPIKIKVTGSPIMLAPNQVGINLSEEYPTINMGTVIRSTGPIIKNFNLINNGPSEAEIEIKLYNIEDDLYKGGDMFDIKLVEPMLGSTDLVKLQFDPIQPECLVNDPSIQIFPKHTRIKGRSKEDFRVEFFCDHIQQFNYLVVLKPRLCTDQSQNLGIVPILLNAETIEPKLILDKKIDFQGHQTIKFQRWSYGDSEKETQTFHLINDTKTNLIFHLETSGPFKIIESSTNSVLKYDLLGTSGMKNQKVQNAFNLSSLSSVELKILFENDHNWPMNYRSYKKGELKIKFNNDDVQKIILDGLLLRPNIKLNMNGYEDNEGPETIDFETVHVRNSKILTFYICNQTKVPAKWKLQQVKYPKTKNQGLRTMTRLEKEDEQKVEDPTVFDFNVVEGVLNGPSVPLQKIAKGQVFSTQITDIDNKERNVNPQEIKIKFTVIFFKQPKKSVLYKCKYRIIVEEGPYQDFILKGQGTLDEVREI